MLNYVMFGGGVFLAGLVRGYVARDGRVVRAYRRGDRVVSGRAVRVRVVPGAHYQLVDRRTRVFVSRKRK